MDEPRIEVTTISKPAAWIFELASYRDKTTGEYSGWREVIQVGMPRVPSGSIRNLRPLIVGAPVPYG